MSKPPTPENGVLQSEIVGKAQVIWTLLVAVSVAAATLHHFTMNGPTREPWSQAAPAESLQSDLPQVKDPLK